MPFDGADIETICRTRRAAAAELWESVPQKRFNQNGWQTCALGWLARKEVDSWRYCHGLPKTSFGLGPYDSAAYYFGVNEDVAVDLFSGGWGVLRFAAPSSEHGFEPTAAGIGRALQSSPFSNPGVRYAV